MSDLIPQPPQDVPVLVSGVLDVLGRLVDSHRQIEGAVLCDAIGRLVVCELQRAFADGMARGFIDGLLAGEAARAEGAMDVLACVEPITLH
jgi:hypothetical protein